MKYVNQILWKTVAVTLAAYVAQLVIGWVVYRVSGPVWESAPAFSATIVPTLAGMALTVLVLVYPTARSVLRGGRLFLALFLAIFGLNVFLTNIEGVIFLVMTPQQLWSGIAYSTLSAAVVSALLVAAFGRGETAPRIIAPGSGFTPGQWVGRTALAAVSYLVLYFVAGMLILPHIREFYDTQNMQIGLLIFPLQIFRGALYVLFVLYLLRNIAAPKWQTCLAMAAMFPVLAGVAGLLSPNPIMPDHVRHWHILEIGWSNFAYGLLVGYLFWNGARKNAGQAADNHPVSPERTG
jgi:hypothetical protein